MSTASNRSKPGTRATICVLVTALLLSLCTAAAYANDVSAYPVKVFMRFSLPYEQYLLPVHVISSGDIEDAVRTLITSPTVDGPLEPLLPPATELLELVITNGTAYVNLSAEAVTANVGGRGDELIVMGIVNSVAQFPGVDRVQILIEGEIREAIWGHVDTSRPIAPDLSLMFTGFSDVKDHWAEGQILAYCLQGTIAGYPDGMYHPSQMVTRAEFLKILVGALGLPVDHSATKQTFDDVSPSHWAHPYIEAAVENGFIIPADYGANFNPGTELGRQELAVILVRAADLEQRAGELAGTELSFSDTAHLPAWAAGYIAAANEQGLMVGYPDNTFRPQGKTTRAETAVVVSRISETSAGQIAVAWPYPGLQVADRILIMGAARVFEATVQFRTILADTQIGTSGFVNATTGGPEWGLFAAFVPVSPEVVAVELYWDSPKDGMPQDIVTIPLTQ